MKRPVRIEFEGVGYHVMHERKNRFPSNGYWHDLPITADDEQQVRIFRFP